jgi:transcriptional regulator with XRE-family HTH domain
MSRSKGQQWPEIELGGRIRRHREERGWTLPMLAKRSGLHKTYVGQIERGERNPSLVVVIQIADAFGFDPAALVHGMRRNPDASAGNG